MNDELFTLEYKKNYRKLYLVALSIVKDSQLAEDAVQEAALKSYRNISTLREASLFSTWLTRILINECYMILRKNKNVMLLESFESLEEKGTTFSQTQYDFLHIISNLKDKDKKIISLRYLNQMSLNEISDVLNIPLSTVKSRLYRALKELRKDWGELA